MKYPTGERSIVGCVQRTGMLAALLSLLLLAGCGQQSIPSKQALAKSTQEMAIESTATPIAAKPDLTLASASTTPALDRSVPVRPISFDAIKFNIAVGQPFERAMLTPAIEKLLGKRIRIRGWIHPDTMMHSTGTSFVLVRDNKECCFGPGAAIFDCIWVHMRSGTIAEFSAYPIAVEGVLTLEEVPDPVNGETLAIYRLDAEVAQ